MRINETLDPIFYCLVRIELLMKNKTLFSENDNLIFKLEEICIHLIDLDFEQAHAKHFFKIQADYNREVVPETTILMKCV